MSHEFSPIEKLDDTSLESISGGLGGRISLYRVVTDIGYCGGTIGALGCLAGSAIYRSKASAALRDGDAKKHDKLNKTAKNLAIGAASCTGVLAATMIANRIHMIRHWKCYYGKAMYADDN